MKKVYCLSEARVFFLENKTDNVMCIVTNGITIRHSLEACCYPEAKRFFEKHAVNDEGTIHRDKFTTNER